MRQERAAVRAECVSDDRMADFTTDASTSSSTAALVCNGTVEYRELVGAV